jgi:hypothetical protein
MKVSREFYLEPPHKQRPTNRQSPYEKIRDVLPKGIGEKVGGTFVITGAPGSSRSCSHCLKGCHFVQSWQNMLVVTRVKNQQASVLPREGACIHVLDIDVV